MKQVYMLIPLLTFSNQNLFELQRILNLSSDQYQVHQINNDKLAVQMYDISLGYSEITAILEQYSHQKQRINILQNCIRNYDWNYKQTLIQSTNVDSLVKKSMKYKQVKEQNKKLKKILQNQLENTQKVRQQTQRTMKILRQQFDSFVREMNRQSTEKSRQIGNNNRKIIQEKPIANF